MSLDERNVDVQSLNTHWGVSEPNQGIETFVSEDRLEVEDIEAVIPFEEVPCFEIPEFNQKSKTKRVRRYGLLQDFQYKDLTEGERKKLEKSRKKNKKAEKNLQVSELEGRSLSDSDLQAIWELGTREAEKAISLGNDLGIKFRGDKNEVIHEIATLEVADISKKRVALEG
ncbi:hypothetical protein V6N11_071055 [Hibiscus sabdariffa]|uniref:Uncharacterized protein n=1 Tax=Hibiscus sabdariffa TaxID=183260 RepID=A0ABR2A727_9ROSI